LAKRIQDQYLYNPSFHNRINPFKRGIDSIRRLLNSPKSWLRGRVGKVFTKGLAKAFGRVFVIAGLVDDLYTIGEACWLGLKAYEAQQGVRQQDLQCQEIHEDLEAFRNGLSPEQRDQIQDLYLREQRYKNQWGQIQPK